MQHVTKRIYLIYDRNARNGTSLHGNGQAERTGKQFGQKTQELAYIAVLSAIRMIGGLNFHVKSAKTLGATRDEIKSAVLIGLPVAGITLADALEAALCAYDEP